MRETTRSDPTHFEERRPAGEPRKPFLIGGYLIQENGRKPKVSRPIPASVKAEVSTGASDAQSTEKSTCSERKLLANRANASKSTGPRTARGKSFSAQNAFKHGALADPMLIPDVDDKAMFQEMVMRLWREKNPKNLTEEILLLTAAKCLWRMERADMAERAEIEKAVCREAYGPSIDPESIS